MAARFELKPADNKKVRRCMAELNLPHFIVSTCVARGFDTAEKIKQFLNPTLERDWGNPYDIPGLDKVVDALEVAVREKKRILVFGDFDLDGISSTSVLTRGLRALGATVTPFIPNRFDEGYGISSAAFERAKVCNPEVLVTVDCGIANRDEVEAIKATGIEILITDHHEAGDAVPKDVPICDPKYKGCERDATLAGVGVALKVIQALGSRFGFPHLWRSYVDIATLGTIADMMEMGGQNRALVLAGLERIKTQCRPCIEALLNVAGALPAEANSMNLSFSVIPKLNAAGRLGKADVALDLMLSDDYDEAQTLAERLGELNEERRRLENELSEVALQKAREKWHGQRFLVVAGEGWHEGVKGIVAAHLVEEFKVPTILFSIDGDEAHGSGRSVGSINLFELVDAQKDLCVRYGGHAGAVGVTVKTSDLAEFERRLNESLKDADGALFEKTVTIDSVVSLNELTLENVLIAEKIAPYGQGNKQPLYLAKNVTEFDGREVGVGGNHFLCKLSNGQTKLSCIQFRCDNIDELLKQDAVVNAIFTVEAETWRGVTTVKAKAEAILPLYECPALSSLCSDETAEFIEDLFTNPEFDVADEKAENSRESFVALAHKNPDALEAEIIHSLIGDGELHEAQKQVLENLKAGVSTLAVMATGRGKSLPFQTFAAMQALSKSSASVFVYPLRALMADQAYAINSKLSRFGINAAILNGATAKDERDEIYAELKNGEIDIILTTPEFLKFNSSEIAESGRIGFVVIDEAHHFAEDKMSRVAYSDLGEIVHQFGDPTVLCVSATVPKNVEEEIASVLNVTHRVTDETQRSNLKINDKRNISHRDDYLAQLVAEGQKTIIYVSTREQSIAVARRLRARVPQLAPYVGFYCGGLKREERTRIEDLFRKSQIQVLVATSAFGEGIDIPDVRNVVMYHMPLSEIEFNQMAGRAGRDGGESWVHLLYGKRDASVNEAILREQTPNRDVMAVIYKKILDMQKKTDGALEWTESGLAKKIGDFAIRDARYVLTPQMIKCALTVFGELHLIEDDLQFSESENLHKITIVPGASKVELTESARYCEGVGAIEDFLKFSEWTLGATVKQLTNHITHPIINDLNKGKI